ncbi:hypothetical protein D3C76_1673530 [compost metagenome]
MQPSPLKQVPIRFWSVARPKAPGLARPSLSSRGTFNGMILAFTWPSCAASSALKVVLSWVAKGCIGVPKVAGVRPRSGNSQTMM